MMDAGGSITVTSATPLEPQPETVDALLSAAVRVIEDERARGNTADTKAGQLVGFTGRNNRKLDVVSRAGLLLMIGVVALACEGGTLAVEHLAISTPK
jgi:hypothetical protein